MKINIFIKLDDFENGKLVKSGEFKPANSLVQGFIAWVCNQCFQSTGTTIKDFNGVNRQFNGSCYSWWTGSGGKPGVGVTTHGILAGTGDTPVTVEDYTLEALIGHGSGTGELEYSAQVEDTHTVISAPNAYFQISRLLTNSSGSTVTIKEIGLVTNHVSTTFRILFDRTIITPHDVLDGKSVRITYRWQISV